MSRRTQSANLKAGKIVILIGQFARGGSERQAYLLARELRQQHNLDVEVWALFFPGEYSKEFEAAGVPTRVLGFHRPQCPVRLVRAWHWARRLLSVAHQFRKSRINILLPVAIWPNVIAGLTYRLGNVRLCIWGERSPGIDRVRLERIALRQYRCFIANSTAGVEFLAGEMGVERARISYVPDGVEQPKIDRGTDWRAGLGLSSAQPVVLKVGDVTRDHASLLRTWKTVQDDWPGGDRPVLVLAGSPGETYKGAQRLTREAGLEATVRFLVSIQDVATLIHASDIAVFGSHSEGTPNNLLECMAAGKAVIASDLPGIRDVLGPNAAELVVPSGDSEQFAQKILALLRDKEKRDALGEANRTRIRAEFSVEHMVEGHLKVIQENLPTVSSGRRRERELLRSQEGA